MSLGLKRGVVELNDHDPQWKVIAAATIERLWSVFGDAAKDIQHHGSTSITGIKAKPIIDIAVAVDSFSEVGKLIPALELHGFMYRDWRPNENEQMMFTVGTDLENDRITTHSIHIVRHDTENWHDYINFRDYLNAMPNAAREYEALKLRLAQEFPYSYLRQKYSSGKHDFIIAKQMEARIWNDSGRKFAKIRPINKG